jgi:hypothetical protein
MANLIAQTIGSTTVGANFNISILFALLLLMLPVGIFATSMAIKMALEN